MTTYGTKTRILITNALNVDPTPLTNLELEIQEYLRKMNGSPGLRDA